MERRLSLKRGACEEAIEIRFRGKATPGAAEG
jgi:hypothetical protein